MPPANRRLELRRLPLRLDRERDQDDIAVLALRELPVQLVREHLNSLPVSTAALARQSDFTDTSRVFWMRRLANSGAQKKASNSARIGCGTPRSIGICAFSVFSEPR